MKLNKSFRKSLLEGKLLIGSWITLAHPAIAEILSSAGFDWLAIDLEHSVISVAEAEELIRVINLSGVVPLARLTSNDPQLIKRIMDSGCHGIIVPMVNSAEDARMALSAMKYPPEGRRGIGLARAQGYGTQFVEYLEWQCENSVLIVQIEHIDAVNNIDQILSVEGVDGYIIGPYDLTGSMGIPGQFDHPDFLAALEKIKTAATALQVTGGIHIIEPDTDTLNSKVAEGNKFIAYSLDFRMLDSACRSALATVKEKTE